MPYLTKECNISLVSKTSYGREGPHIFFVFPTRISNWIIDQIVYRFGFTFLNPRCLFLMMYPKICVYITISFVKSILIHLMKNYFRKMKMSIDVTKWIEISLQITIIETQIILHILVITKNKLKIFARFVRIALNQLDTSLRQISLCQDIHFIFSDVSNMRPEKRQAMVANVKYCYIICNFHIFKHI